MGEEDQGTRSLLRKRFDGDRTPITKATAADIYGQIANLYEVITDLVEMNNALHGIGDIGATRVQFFTRLRTAMDDLQDGLDELDGRDE